MKKHISVLRVFLVGTGLAGAATVVVSGVVFAQHASSVSAVVNLNSPWSPFSMVLFLVLGVAASSFVILVPEAQGNASSHNLATVGILAAIVVFPAYIAVIIVGAVATFSQLAVQPSGKRAWQFTAFNIGNFILSGALAAVVFNRFGGAHILLHPNLPRQAPQLILSIAAAVSVSYVVSYGLLVTSVYLFGLAMARRSRDAGVPSPSPSSIGEIFTRSHRNAILPEATAAIVGILFGYLWLVNPPLAPIALLPLAVIYIAFKNFIRLQELDRLKSNFITEVSHELRTPLSAILASSELLYHHSDRLDGDSIQDLSRSSYESSNHLFRVVENLLNASTIQSGTLSVKPVSVSLDEMIDEATTQVQPFLESKNQALGIDVPSDLPEVLADPRHIVQVLINLLTNASKYSADGTTIGIACSAEDDIVRIDVTDQGVGISEEEQRHIFERFYRVPSNAMTSVVGSGLGLTIVKSLVEMHRGRVGVTSSPGSGSTFWFTLPQSVMAQGI